MCLVEGQDISCFVPVFGLETGGIELSQQAIYSLRFEDSDAQIKQKVRYVLVPALASSAPTPVRAALPGSSDLE